MKNITKKSFPFLIVLAIILIALIMGISNINGIANDVEHSDYKFSSDETALSSSIDEVNDEDRKEIKNIPSPAFTWQELEMICKESEQYLMSESMTETEINNYLRNKILDYVDAKQKQHIYSPIRSGTTDGEYPSGMSESEFKFSLINPTDVNKVNKCADKAYEMTHHYYGANRGQDNSNAFMHGYWNALMSIEIGPGNAKFYSDAFEETPESVGINKEMNLSNNAVGIADGVTFANYSQDGLAYEIMKRVSFGEYDQIVNEKITLTDFEGLLGKFAFETTDLPNNEIRIDKPILMTDGIYKFPTKINGRILTEIGQSAYQNAIMSMVNFNDDSALRVIDSGVFMGCKNLTYINIPPNVTDIKTFAFKDCVDLYVYYMGNNLKSIWAFAFENTKVVSEPLFPSSVTYIGGAAFASLTNKSTIDQIIIPSTLADIKASAFNGNDHATFYTEFSSKPSGWSSNWNTAVRPVVWGCNLSADNSYVVSFYNSHYNISNANAINGISNPKRSGYTFDGWYTTSNYTGTQFMNIATAPSGNLYAKWTESCVAEGSLITLADGTQVAVEDLTGDEMLLVWNMKTGTFDAAPILFIDNHARTSYSVINLYFSDGTSVKVIDEHAFWNSSLNRYTFLRSDAAKYIGDSFNKQTTDANGNMTWSNVELVDVVLTNEVTTAWSPVTYSHLCYYVNGMLSMPGGTTGLINIFDVNAETMTIDIDAYNADIAEYGLFTYEEFAELYPVSEMVFNAFDAQYFKVAIGKGILTFEMIEDLLITYGEFLN